MKKLKDLNKEEYRKKRKLYITCQQAAIGLLTALLLIFSFVYFKVDKAKYASYSENGNAIHYAHLNQDGQEWFQTDKLNGTHAYVSSFVDKMSADFSYRLQFETAKVSYQYTYDIQTQIEVIDVASRAPLFNPIVETQVEKTSVSGVGKSFEIANKVEIDFLKYDDRVDQFLRETNLKEGSTSSSLVVRMSVAVSGTSETFTSDYTNQYVTELRIPLRQVAFKPIVSATAPAGEKRIRAVGGNKGLPFGILAIFSLAGLLGVAGWFAFFVLRTKDNFIDYSMKVQRICKNYKSYIQKIEEEFPEEGGKLLRLGEFSDLLEIRDVVQKPILMHENAEKTCTKFVISSDGYIYLHEVKMQDVDDEIGTRSVGNGGEFVETLGSDAETIVSNFRPKKAVFRSRKNDK